MCVLVCSHNSRHVGIYCFNVPEKCDFPRASINPGFLLQCPSSKLGFSRSETCYTSEKSEKSDNDAGHFCMFTISSDLSTMKCGDFTFNLDPGGRIFSHTDPFKQSKLLVLRLHE